MVLQPFRCAAEAKKFLPEELPALYSTNADAHFLRSLEQSREVANPLFGSVLSSLAGPARSGPYAQLCFNFNNPLVRRLAAVRDRKVLQRSVQMLYVQREPDAGARAAFDPALDEPLGGVAPARG